MSKPTIHFGGAWSYAWAAMATVLLGWMLWSTQAGSPYLQLLGLRVWFTLFMALELSGAYVNEHRDGPETVRTLSQLLQRIAQMPNDEFSWRLTKLLGWRALVVGFLLMISWAAKLAFSPISPTLGWVFGVTVALWNVAHWLYRSVYG